MKSKIYISLIVFLGSITLLYGKSETTTPGSVDDNGLQIVFKAGQGYLKSAEGPKREFSVNLSEPLFRGGKLIVKTGDRSASVIVPASKSGITRIDGTFPPGYMYERESVVIELQSRQGNVTQVVEVAAARPWKLYFLPHSHLDIGYTHVQDDVMALQIRNLEKSIDLITKTRDYNEGSRYKWNAEATWPVIGFLEKYKGTELEKQFIDAVQRGDMGLDATLGSILTGVSKQEELMHIFDDAHKISELTGAEINSAMTSDVPGHSWGIVSAMAENGVRYFSSGPNYVPTLGRLGSHGVGLYNLIWGDVPFWWESQSGTHKILYWQTGKGYSMFHGWLMDKLSVCGVDPIWDYLEELENKEYPYGLTYLRYTIHGDNGPPDEEMPDVIAGWNEKYESPQFVIGTTKELFFEMEKTYGEYLPTYSGDMTPIWEDGAASSAYELAMNRATAERLNQFEILWSMTRPASEFPEDSLLEAWKNVVLFSEHTWGSAASGHEPESDFTKAVWSGKKRFADDADRISKSLFSKLLDDLKGLEHSKTAHPSVIKVFNTNLWKRSDIVKVEGVDLSGRQLLDADGESVLIQKMSDGSWIFFAENLEPMSETVYHIVDSNTGSGRGSKEDSYSSIAKGMTLQNGKIKVVLNEVDGTISSFTVNGIEHEYAGKGGLNQYIYSDQRGESVQGAGKIKSITLLNNGPVAATLRIESEAPGTESLIRDITVYRDLDRVDITNILDKSNVYEYENVRFLFPFNIMNPEITMDLAMSEVHPERDQLVSSNKNFYSIHNGLSVANIKHGIYLSTIDAPLVELGTMTADLTRIYKEAMGWLNASTVSADVYSWVMNNRWRTNYKASQSGVTVFRYSIKAFDPYKPDLKRFGTEQTQPLVAVASVSVYNKDNNIYSGKNGEPLFRVSGNNRIMLSTMRPSKDGDGYIVRLQNASPFSVNAGIVSGRMNIDSAYYSNNLEITGERFNSSSFWLKPYELITIKIKTK